MVGGPSEYVGFTTLLSHDQNTEEGRYCPKCGADWRAQQIPQEYVAKGYYGKLTDEPQYYSRLIGVEYAYGHPDRYDGVSGWRCPDCPTRWSRWTGEELTEDQTARRP